MKWKVIQSESDEFILLSDSLNIQKIKGKNAHDIVSVLLNIQNDYYSIELQKKFPIKHFETEYIDNIKEWLIFNKFIKSDCSGSIEINIVGEFGKNAQLLNKFIKNLPKNYVVKDIFDLSTKPNFKNIDLSTLTLFIAPFFLQSRNNYCFRRVANE